MDKAQRGLGRMAAGGWALGLSEGPAGGAGRPRGPGGSLLPAAPLTTLSPLGEPNDRNAAARLNSGLTAAGEFTPGLINKRPAGRLFQ